MLQSMFAPYRACLRAKEKYNISLLDGHDGAEPALIDIIMDAARG